MRPGRPRLVTALTSVAAVAVVGLVPASPSAAQPDVEDVQSRVDALYRDAEKASERFNDARIELASLRKDLKRLRATEERRMRRLEAARVRVEDSVVRQYEGESVSGVSRVLVSEDPQAFLEQLATMDTYNDVQESMYDDFAAEVRTVRHRSRRTADHVSRLAQVEDDLADDKATIDQRLSEAEALLGRLEEQERERARERAREQEVSRGGGRTLPATARPSPGSSAVSGSAGAAVDYARAQVGDAYVYGASGPDAFDCSGLTSAAWAAAGVSLPHSSSAQYSAGQHVSSDDLQPGDLVFYYQPISHVGIYVGDGMIVHAANPSTGVALAPVFSMPYTGATRPG